MTKTSWKSSRRLVLFIDGVEFKSLYPRLGRFAESLFGGWWVWRSVCQNAPWKTGYHKRGLDSNSTHWETQCFLCCQSLWGFDFINSIREAGTLCVCAAKLESKASIITVDGRNPAAVDMDNITLFTTQVVSDGRNPDHLGCTEWVPLSISTAAGRISEPSARISQGDLWGNMPSLSSHLFSLAAQKTWWSLELLRGG